MLFSCSGKSLGVLKRALPIYHLMQNDTRSKNEYSLGMGISTGIKRIVISYLKGVGGVGGGLKQLLGVIISTPVGA